MNPDNHKTKITAKQLTISAILLAICILSQYFKNVSVFITGPIINACLVLAVLSVGLTCGVILSVITPVTAYLITANPLMSMIPAIIPMIMIGNTVMVIVVYFTFGCREKDRQSRINVEKLLTIRNCAGAVMASVLKAGVMALSISLWLIPAYVPEASPMFQQIPVLQMTFSVFQLITAIIGFVYAYLIWKPLNKMITSGE